MTMNTEHIDREQTVLMPFDVITVETTLTGSFNDTSRIVRLAKDKNQPVRCFILGRWVLAKPDDDPSALYKKSFPEYGI